MWNHQKKVSAYELHIFAICFIFIDYITMIDIVQNIDNNLVMTNKLK